MGLFYTMLSDTSGNDSACSVGATGDMGSIAGVERSTGEGNGNPLQYSCLKNPMDGGASWAEEPSRLQSKELQRIRHD